MDNMNEMSEKELSFRVELTDLLNRYSKENPSNTPDFILAGYLTDCLKAWNSGITMRDSWFGTNRTLSPKLKDTINGPIIEMVVSNDFKEFEK